MAVRETAAQKRARLSMLLADYDNRRRELAKLTKVVEGMKTQIKELKAGTYGEWALSFGTPREITDADAVKQHFVEQGIAMPTKMSAAPIVVTPVAGK